MNSDSRTVIRYICNKNSRFLSYIIHGVTEIRRHSNIENWSYIKTTDDNIAGYCTRARNIENHSNQNRFLIDPEILYQKELTWGYMEPQTRNQQTDNLTLNRELAHVNVTINQPIERITHWDYSSFWNKLVRHITWIIKLKKRLLTKRLRTRH